MAILGVDG
jgi:uptake hydrogenase small subunit